MNHYIVKLDVSADTEFKVPCFVYSVLIKATHPEKAIEIATREVELKVEVVCVKSCTKVNNVDVSILKAYLEG